MAPKSVYHQSEHLGPFEGKQFHTTTKDLMQSDKVYVISSKQKGGKLTPHLEGCFDVEAVIGGDYEIGNRKFKFRSVLTPIARPREPIDITHIRDHMGAGKFASRFMNQVKPHLSQIEINEFDELLLKYQEKVTSIAEAGDKLQQEIQEILQSDTERTQTVLARIGQGKFRENVTTVWGLDKEICVLTGITLPSILTASHIIPWSECIGEKAALRWDGANGILLCAHIDRLFDRYYLSFVRRGTSCAIQYSRSLHNDHKRQLGLTPDLELVPNRMKSLDRERFFGYMETHYKKFLEREAQANT
jgi:hypothetical protein